MADQKRWFKVWTSITSDDDFEPSRPGGLVSLGRFAILGAYTALHGHHGSLEIMPDTLFRLLQVRTLDEIRAEVAFKNVLFEEGKNRYGKVTVTWSKWVTYQEDSTAKDRMKALRAKRRGEEKREDKEEKREDTIGAEAQKKTPRKSSLTPPAIELIREITLRYPPKHLWPELEKQADGATKEELAAAYTSWSMRGYSPTNYSWLKWARNGTPAPAINGKQTPLQEALQILRGGKEDAIDITGGH